MDLLEFQAKELLNRYAIPTPIGRIAETPREGTRAAERLKSGRFVVKVQVRAGERKGAGGIRFAASPEGVGATCDILLGRKFKTTQTDQAGELVRWILVEEAVESMRELYVAIVVNRDLGQLVLLLSKDGGDGIEQRAETATDLIRKVPLAIQDGTATGPIESAVADLGLDDTARQSVIDVIKNMSRLAVELDAVQVEINPLAIRKDGSAIALDAKLSLDDNAMMRHPALAALSQAFDAEKSDPSEREADKHRINYVGLDGETGVIANGAGLGLTTLDLIADCGGSAANFMDIRTTATSLDIAYGTRLILDNPRARAILVNVHGGGMQSCDTIAEGIAVAMSGTSRRLPIVTRLAGNNALFARKRLLDAGLDVTFADTMEDATQKAIAASRSNAA
ncbi:MAG: ATP-grasp domain-containing protein [Pseudomonadota bacterium]